MTVKSGDQFRQGKKETCTVTGVTNSKVKYVADADGIRFNGVMDQDLFQKIYCKKQREGRKK